MRADGSVAAVVLAGGASRRMGQDKALLRLPDGRTALQAVLEAARLVAHPVLLSVDSTDHAAVLLDALPLPHPEVVLDVVRGAGPLAALVAALHTLEASAILLLTGDAPLLHPALLRALCAAMVVPHETPPDLVVPVVHGRPQPMPAVYARGVAEVAERLLLGGRAGPRALIEAPELRVRHLEEVALRAVDPDLRSFRGANTPDEWRELMTLVGPVHRVSPGRYTR